MDSTSATESRTAYFINGFQDRLRVLTENNQRLGAILGKLVGPVPMDDGGPSKDTSPAKPSLLETMEDLNEALGTQLNYQNQLIAHLEQAI